MILSDLGTLPYSSFRPKPGLFFLPAERLGGLLNYYYREAA